MTVYDLKERMSVREFRQWQAYCAIKAARQGGE